MIDDPIPDPDPDDDDDFPDEGTPPERSEPQTQEVQHSQVSALVPESVAQGAFSTGAVVLNGAHEFIIDFLLRMTKPHQVSARVILPPAVVPRMIAALSENIENYKKRFGEPRTPQVLPQPGQQPDQPGQQQGQPGEPGQPGQGEQQSQKPQQQSQTSAQELYEQLKISDEQLSGAYANAVMIGHTATEFSFDFITTFFPKSIVSKRVYLAAPNVPRLLDSLKQSFEQYQRKVAASQRNPPQNPPAPPPPSDPFGL